MAETDWRPIETAPKDGTAVWIAGDDFCGIGFGEAANWLHDTDTWILKSFVTRKTENRPFDDVSGAHWEVTPSFWMPLPSPPSKD